MNRFTPLIGEKLRGNEFAYSLPIVASFTWHSTRSKPLASLPIIIFPDIFHFSLLLFFPFVASLCNSLYSGVFNHWCSVLKTSLGIFCGVLPFQFNELFEFNPFFKDNHNIKVLNILHFEPFFYAICNKCVVQFFYLTHMSN